MKTKEILEFIKIEHTLFSLPFILIGAVLAESTFSTQIDWWWFDGHCQPIYGSSDETTIEKIACFQSVMIDDWYEPLFFVNVLNIDPVLDLILIMTAAIGARGLAMTLNRIIDKEIDAANPRTASRLLPSGRMSDKTAWLIAGTFLSMLVISAAMLNEVALYMSWLPVAAFVIYPYMKRISWLCHFWLGLCLALGPAGAWLAFTGDIYGWQAITGFYWYPTIFWISLGVLFWITAFDINYARMDIENDIENGIHSFPAKFGLEATEKMSVILCICWVLCFIFSGLSGFSLQWYTGGGTSYEAGKVLGSYAGFLVTNGGGTGAIRYILWLPASLIMMAANLWVMTSKARTSHQSKEKMRDFQDLLFKVSMATGWVLLLSMNIVQVWSGYWA